MEKKKLKKILLTLSVMSAPAIVNETIDNNIAKAEYKNNLYYENGKLANWWYDDGTDWYFFKNGIKLTGKGRDANGERYFANGKYANWWYADGKDWYFFQNGIKHTGKGRDANGERYFVNGKYAEGVYGGKTYKNGIEEKGRGYKNNLYYENGKLANWWYDDGTDWYFFQNGIKHTGKGRDANGERYFVNGKYANGVYDGKTYKDGLEKDSVYKNNLYYVKDKLANWWYDDGTDWYFFQNGIKHTGKGRDANGERYFANGKYANWWYADGKDWYFFQNGIKHTGKGRDANGERYFVNGKYANWWYDDGTDWYFFQNGIKHTGKGRDANGERYFVNGKYANGVYGGKTYRNGIEENQISGKKLADISQHNGNIDFYKLKNEVDGVIIRVGYGTAFEDKKWRQNVEGAIKAGIPYGFYWYSYALNETHAQEEANKFLSLISKYQPSYPIFIDMEDADYWKQKQGSHHMGNTWAGREKIIKIHLNTYEKNGYFGGVYASKSWFDAMSKDLNKYTRWVAHWTQNPNSYKNTDYGLHQYTSQGKANGVVGNLDLNIAHVDYPTVIRRGGFNNWKIAP